MVRTDDEFPWFVVLFSLLVIISRVGQRFTILLFVTKVFKQRVTQKVWVMISLKVNLHEDTRLIKLAKKQKSYKNLRKDH